MTVLLWGRHDEPVVRAVADACRAHEADIVTVDGDEIASVDLDGELVTADDRRIPLDRVTGVFVRPEARLTSSRAALAFHALGAWCETTTTAVVLNRPSSAASNRSKPYQLGLIADAGFAVPETLVTTDPADVRAFCAEHDKVIYKSVSGVRSIVAVLTRDDDERLEDVSVCPTQFQAFVAGVDYRVHVIGATVLACRIESPAVDYRYATGGATTSMTPAALPEGLAERCVELTRALGLGLAGIDLRVDERGTWWCFEVNTSPGFIWFEQHTGLPIAAAVARALTAGTGGLDGRSVRT